MQASCADPEPFLVNAGHSEHRIRQTWVRLTCGRPFPRRFPLRPYCSHGPKQKYKMKLIFLSFISDLLFKRYEFIDQVKYCTIYIVENIAYMHLAKFLIVVHCNLPGVRFSNINQVKYNAEFQKNWLL